MLEFGSALKQGLLHDKELFRLELRSLLEEQIVVVVREYLDMAPLFCSHDDRAISVTVIFGFAVDIN